MPIGIFRRLKIIGGFMFSSGHGGWTTRAAARRRDPRRYGAAALAAVLVLTTADAVHAEPAPSPTAAAEPAPSPEAAAIAEAAATGKPVRIGSATTETSEFFARPDGQIEATIAAGIVRLRRGQDWVPVDLNLRTAPDGSVQAQAHPADLRVSGERAGSAGELASVDTSAGRISMGWDGALPAPVLAGPRATYRDVRPGVDLVVEATRTGFEQFVVLKAPAAAAHVEELTLPLTGGGVTSAEEHRDGSIDLTGANGDVTASVPTPLMWDARVSANGETPAKTVALNVAAVPVAEAAATPAAKGRDSGVALELNADQDFLHDPSTRYPVTIDPQIDRLLTTFDTTVMEGVSADRGGANYLQLGVTSSAQPQKARSFVKWDSSELAGEYITQARAYFYNWYSTTCTATPWEIWTTEPADADTRWSNQPKWLRREATSTETKGFSSSCGDGWVSIDARSFFQYASDTDQTVADMGIRATSETDSKQWKEFRSRNAADTAQVPYAKVTYRSYPHLRALNTLPPSTCTTGASRPDLGNLPPKLSATYVSADATSIETTFEWWTLTGTTPIGSAKASRVVSDGTPHTVTIPETALATGSSYRWRVRATDGVATSPWSAWCEFKLSITEVIDTTWQEEPDAPGEDTEVPGEEAEDFSEEGLTFEDSADTEAESDTAAEFVESPEATINPEADADFQPDTETDLDDPSLLQDPAQSFETQAQRETMKIEFEEECGQGTIQEYSAQANRPTYESQALADKILADYHGTVYACQADVRSADIARAVATVRDRAGESVDAGGDTDADFTVARAGTPRYKKIPSWCTKKWETNYSDKGKWVFSRLGACFYDMMSVVFYIVNRNGTSSIVGQAPFVYTGMLWADRAGKSLRWGYQVNLQLQDNAWGAAAYLRVAGDGLTCSNRRVCSVAQRDWGGTFNWNNSHQWSSGFIKASVRKGKRAQMTAKWKWHFYSPGFSGWLDRKYMQLSTPNVRCDHANPMDSRSVGCIVPGSTPWVTYSLSGAYPTLAHHIRDAQSSGLPGRYSPRGAPLTRTSNKATQKANRKIACPGSLDRPDGRSCDEYPFASTRQGGASGGTVRTFNWCQVSGAIGATGSSGVSRCMIDKDDNSKGGRKLQTFYSKNRVLNGDKFRVRIVS